MFTRVFIYQEECVGFIAEILKISFSSMMKNWNRGKKYATLRQKIGGMRALHVIEI